MREMKQSGIRWIGEIPNNWNIIRFKYLHTGLNTGVAIDKEYWSDDERDPVFYTAGLKAIRTNYTGFPEWKYTKESDLLLARNGTPYVYYPVAKACYTDHIIRASMKNEVNRKFIQYCLQQSIMNVVVDSVSLATWSASLWNEQVLPYPSKEVQQSIVDQLDRKCTQIDALIENAQHQIEKLKAYKQSCIGEAVIKGLNPETPMKDSGIEWLGEIPEHWNVAPIRSLFRIKKDIIGHEPETVLSITQKGIKVKDISENSGQMANSYDHYQIVKIGDFAMNHMDLLTGGVGISEFEGVTSPDYRVFVIRNSEMNPRYFLYVFQMYYQNKIFYAFGQGAANLGRWRLPAQNFNKIAIPLAPIKEQNEIVSFLDRKCEQIEHLIVIKQKKIEKLQQYKKSVIYEYITGKKEV